jgi:hypothetical protein
MVRLSVFIYISREESAFDRALLSIHALLCSEVIIISARLCFLSPCFDYSIPSLWARCLVGRRPCYRLNVLGRLGFDKQSVYFFQKKGQSVEL